MKKSHKRVSENVVPDVPAPVVEETVVQVESAPLATKKTRKRAADFLDDASETVAAVPKKGKKSKATTKTSSASLTADGANGVVENPTEEGVTITTAATNPKQQSMMAEAERTQDEELANEYNSEDSDANEIDSAPALLTGFDSDNDDTATDLNFDPSKPTQPIPNFKKTSKKLRQAASGKSTAPGTVYIGRIPHGFYEAQMKEYFSQFGHITRLRLSRNKKTGASKHFAFIEFDSDEVAKIVAETMDNYLMFGHILRCKYAPEGTLHKDVWKGANRRYHRAPRHKIAMRRSLEAGPKSEEQVERMMGKEQRKRKVKQEKMKSLGYEYELPVMKKPEVNGDAAVENGEAEKQSAIEDKVEGAVVPPPNVPKDELATKVEEAAKAGKKGRKEKKSKNNAAPVEVETPVAVVNEAVAAVEPAAEVKTDRKSKRKAEKEAQGAAADTAKDVLSEQKETVKKQKVKSVSTEVKPAASGKAEGKGKGKKAASSEGTQLKGILKKPKKA